MSVYFWIILLTFTGPFILSFDKKVSFYKHFIPLFLAALGIALPFIAWDIYFTESGVWGFTPDYLSGIYFYNLPLEECLFFIVVPFACLFIHEVLKAYFPNFRGHKLSYLFASLISLSALALGLSFFDHWYTASTCFLAVILTVGIFFLKITSWYRHFVFTYLVALLPFLVVNGILTGAITENPIVWYSEKHITGWRIYTIPVEDLFYNYNLLLGVTLLFEFLKRRFSDK